MTIPVWWVVFNMLTFEAIRDIERQEKDNKKLQKLPERFFEQVREYLIRKEGMKEKSSIDLLEMQNAKNAIKRLMELRERKVLDAALVCARTGLPVENLTKNEEAMFSVVVQAVKKNRGFVEEAPQEQVKKEILYRVKRSVPDFVGPDMKLYSLRENEILTLPKDAADLLLKEDIVERV